MEDERRIQIRQNVKLTDKQKHSIDELFIHSYGQRIPYTWHEHYMAFTGNFDVNYFPELLYIPEFEYYMNQNEDYYKSIEDKNFISNIAESVGVAYPKNVISCVNGIYRDDSYSLIDKNKAISLLNDAGKIFMKPSVGFGSGKGCFIADCLGGIDSISSKSVDQIVDECGLNFAAQEVVTCHESLRKIYDGCVNTFRVISYIWRNEVYIMPIILRIGQGGNYVDNAHADGMFIAIDEKGLLAEKAFTEFRNEYAMHPNSRIIFLNYFIPGIKRIKQAAVALHSRIPQIGVINWDFTLNQYGDPLLIEANVQYGSIWVIQMAHGKGPFGEKTAEGLQWLRLMNSLPEHEYKKYCYGKLND